MSTSPEERNGETEPRARTRHPGWLLAALSGVVVLVYLETFGFGIIATWDDAAYVLNRPTLLDWWGSSWRDVLLTPETGYPTPVPTAIWAHLRLIFGEEEHYFTSLHVLSVALHVVNALLAFVVTRRWVDRRSAVAVAVLWSLHPVAVESVAWVTNLKTLLYCTGLLTAMYAWERILDDDRRGLSTGLLVVAFCLGIGSRPDMAVLPAVLVLQALRRPRSLEVLRAHWRPLLVLTSASVAGLAAAAIGHTPFASRSELMESSVSSTAELFFVSVARCFSHWIAPVDLQPAYFADADAMSGEIAVGVVVTLVVGASIVAAWRSGRRHLTFAMTLAVALYLPYSQLVFIPRLAADTYLYVPTFAATVAAVSAWRQFVAPRLRTRELGWLSVVVVVGLAGSLALLSADQVKRWENGITLWAPLIERSPSVARPYRHVAYEYFRRGDLENAVRVLDAGFPAFRTQRNIPFWVALIYEQAGQPIKAANVAMEALDIMPTPRPEHSKTLIEVLVRNETPLPPPGETREAVIAAAEVYLQHEEWLRERNAAIVIGHYFLQRDAPALSASFIKRALAFEEPHCDAWTVAELLAATGYSRVETPALPERCRREHD